MGIRKESSTAQPLVVEVGVPANITLTDEMIASVLLHVVRAEQPYAPFISAAIAEDDWVLAGDVGSQTLTVTWRETVLEAGASAQLPEGDYVAEVWITDTDGRQVRAPGDGYVEVPITPPLGAVEES